MINSKKELVFFIQADRMMNMGCFQLSFKQRVQYMLGMFPVLKWMTIMRKSNYYDSTYKGLIALYYNSRFQRLSMKLGFSIGKDVFGYGLVIPHWGTIVVGPNNKIGNYAVLHTSTCISDNGKMIGDGLYLATGAKMTSKVVLGDNVTVGANSVVNKSFPDGNIMIAGSPAKYIKDAEAWYDRDGLKRRVEKIEALKKKMLQ